MKKFLKYTLTALIAVTLISCNEDEILDDWKEINPVPSVPEISGDNGDADLSNLVVLGTSLASGFQDGALYTKGQANSFPALVATQMQANGVGGTSDFGQPDINSDNGFNVFLNNPLFGRTVLDISDETPVPTAGDLTSILTPWSGTTSTLNNFSVPLAQAGQLVEATTGGSSLNRTFSSFYARFASSPSKDGAHSSTLIGDALSAKGTFFIYEAGMNDVALYAAGGATSTLGTLTASNTFKRNVDDAIHRLASAGTSLAGRLDGGVTPSYTVEGVVLNIPPILAFPFFQAAKWNAIPLDAETATTLNTSLAPVNAVIQGSTEAGYSGDVSGRLISYSEGGNAILVWDDELEDLTPYFNSVVTAQVSANSAIIAIQDDDTRNAAIQAQVTEIMKSMAPYVKSRPLVEGEIVPLSTVPFLNTEADGDDTEKTTPYGVVIPLGFSFTKPADGDSLFISKAEVIEIETARAIFNAHLAGAVADVNTAGGDVILVDIEAIFLDAAGLSDGELGIRSQGLNLDPDFAPNGIFSSDGIHPAQRGHGLVANAIIEAINAEWDASIPRVEIAPLAPPPFQQ